MDRTRDPELPGHAGGFWIVLFVAILAGIGVLGAWWTSLQAGAEPHFSLGLGFSLVGGLVFALLLTVAWPRFKRQDKPAASPLIESGVPAQHASPPQQPASFEWIHSFCGPAFVVRCEQAADDWRVVACNAKAAHALQMSESEMRGETLSTLWLRVPAWPQTALHALLQRHGRQAQTMAQVIPKRAGERWEVHYQALPAQESGLNQMLVTLWPVTDAHGDDADDNQAFSYAVSHDLRAPLRVVEGFSRIIKEDYGHQLDRVGNDHLDRVMAAATRMNSMIDALLAQAQLASRPLSRQRVNLSQLAEFVLDDLRRQHPERDVECIVESGLEVMGDPTLLRMMMDNLLGNAWKYSAQTRRAKIEFGRMPAEPAAGEAPGLEAMAGKTRYFVRDNGVGFDMRFADRLFGIFQRLHSASDYPGTGLGLASVRRIIHRHGGDIVAESAVGQGACFYFTLPER